MSINYTSQRSTRLLYVAYGLVMSVVFDLFFWNHGLGLNFLLFFAIGTVGMLALLFFTKEIRLTWPLALLVPAGILAVDVMVYNNDLTQSLTPLVSLLLVALTAILATLRGHSRDHFKFQNIPVIKNIFTPIKHLGEVFGDIFTRQPTKNSDLYKKILIGVLISVPILLVFVFLFVTADGIFAHWIENVFKLNIPNAGEIFWRSTRTIFLTVVFACFLYVLLSEEHALGQFQKAVKKFDITITGVVLVLVNALFLTFTFIQIRYLFGDVDFVRNAGITFADYARNGFFQLVWVMVLSGLLLLFVYRSESHNGRNKLLTVLSLMLCAQVYVIAASALKRMGLYQEAYGYTTLRLYVEWFIYFVMILYAFLAVGVIVNWNFKHFFHTGLALGLVAFTAVASINVDRIIAKQNVDRYIAGKGNFDLPYISTLSYDAVPELVRAYNASQKNISTEERIAEYLSGIRMSLIKRNQILLEYNMGAQKAQSSIERENNARFNN